MGEWLSKTLGQVATLNYGKSLPVKRRIPGVVPVYGSNGIVGWHNKAIVNKAGIIVGRKGSVGAVHLSDKPFCPIDTTYFITADDTKADINFLYYLLLHLNLLRYVSDLVPGLNRDLAYAQDMLIPDTVFEQRRIAAILSLVQRAIEQQERLIALTTELKWALMHKLFTEGTRGEPQKQTEIGPIPESWEVVEVGDIFKFTSGKTKPKETNAERTDALNIPVYGGNGVLGYSAESLLNRSTLILGRVGEYCGCAHLTEDICWVTDNALYLKQQNRDVNLAYIKNHFEFLNLNKYSNKMGQPLITQGIIHKVKFGLPSADEQGELADIFSLIDTRIETLSQKKDNLQTLFRTLLHQLMTAEIRVKDLDLGILGIDFNEGQAQAV